MENNALVCSMHCTPITKVCLPAVKNECQRVSALVPLVTMPVLMPVLSVPVLVLSVPVLLKLVIM